MPNLFGQSGIKGNTDSGVLGSVLDPVSIGTEVKLTNPQSPKSNIPTAPLPGHLIEPQFAAPYYAWKEDPSKQNTDTLLRTARPILTKSLRAFTSAESRVSPTMMMKAKLMFLNTLRNYDPSKAKLNTYMVSQLQGLRRSSVKEERIIGIPEQKMLQALKLRKTEEDFELENGYKPSDNEIVSMMGISMKRLEQLRTAQRSYSAISPTIFEKEDSSEETSYDPGIASDPRNREWLEMVWDDLGPKSPTRNPGAVSDGQFILQHTFGLRGHEVLKNQEIAKRLGITASAVSQQKIKLQKLLDKQHELEGEF